MPLAHKAVGSRSVFWLSNWNKYPATLGHVEVLLHFPVIGRQKGKRWGCLGQFLPRRTDGKWQLCYWRWHMVDWQRSVAFTHLVTDDTGHKLLVTEDHCIGGCSREGRSVGYRADTRIFSSSCHCTCGCRVLSQRLSESGRLCVCVFRSQLVLDKVRSLVVTRGIMAPSVQGFCTSVKMGLCLKELSSQNVY